MESAKSPTRAGTGIGEELFALADAIGAVVGGAVAIEDLDRRVLAYSTLPGQRIDELRRRGILGRRVPEQPEQPEEQLLQYRQVLAAPGVLRLPVLSPDELPRAAVAVRAGDRPLGTIWAIEGGSPVDAAGERALLDGARLAALHLLHRRSAAELDVQAREDALRAALRGRRTAREARFELGLGGQRPLALLGFASNCPRRDLLVRLNAAAARHWAAVHAESSVATSGRAVYVLLPLDEPASAEATAARLGRQAVAVLGRILDLPEDTPLRGAVSRVSGNVEDLPELRSEVDDILRATTADPDAPALAGLADTHTRVLLAHVADELARRPRLRHPGVDAMLAHDRERGTAYAESVTAWLDAVGSVSEAAQRLTVHPNTLKYRLRRARELFAVDLDHPDDRLSCWLQLRLGIGGGPS